MTLADIKKKYLVTFINPFPSLILAGFLAAIYFGLTGTFWAVTGEFTRWGGHILQFFGMDLSSYSYYTIIHHEGTPLTRIDGVMVLGMFAASFSMALMANNIKLRFPKYKRRILQALIGGFIAGFGARLSMGCNLAAFFTGIPQFSLHAWLFTIATVFGTYVGVKIATLPFLRVPVELQKNNELTPINNDISKERRHFVFGVIFLVISLLFVASLFFKSSKLGYAAFFGMVFGAIIERSQICFTSAFRDLWPCGRTQMIKAIIWGMAISSIFVLIFIKAGTPPKILWAGPNTIIGGFLFGIGIVIAGGCETGWMYRAVEGQVHYIFVGIGNIIGATVLALSWDRLAPTLVLKYPKVNLLTLFGDIGGLLVTLLLLAICYLLVIWWERRFFRRLK